MQNFDFSKPISDNKLLKTLARPAMVDTTSETVVYEAYIYGEQYHICKIDMSTPIITRSWAAGAWDDRETLQYV